MVITPLKATNLNTLCALIADIKVIRYSVLNGLNREVPAIK